MEEEIAPATQVDEVGGRSQRTKVSFPEPRGKNKIVLVLVFLVGLLIAGGLGWYFFTQEEEELILEPTPSFEEEITPTPTEALIDKEVVRIEILNGTGIPGAAGSLRDEFVQLGYLTDNISVGNAGTSDHRVTDVTFDSDFPESARNEMVRRLREVYEDVEESASVLADFEVRVITGYPRGHTPTPTRPAATPTPTPAEEGSTPTPTPEETPTPTPAE